MNDDEIEKSAMIEMNAEDVHDFSYSQGEEKEEEKDNAIVLEDEDEGDFPAPPKPSRNLTFRAVIIGGLIGSLVCSSNIYIGLKTGWSLGSSVFASIIGFVMIRLISKFINTNSALLNFLIGGDKENEKENCLLTTSAVAAGGLTAGYVSAMPALSWFGYSYSPAALFLWTFSAGFFGMFFAIPLRHYALITKNLKFPSGISTAVAIKSMYSSASGSSLAITQAKLLGLWFLIGLSYTILSQYIPVLYNIPIFAYLSIGGRINVFKQLALWRWSINVSPAFIGTGMMVGMNVGISFLLGNIAAWGILGPLIVYFGWVAVPFGFVDPIGGPSAQYWLLWVGISMMVTSSLTEVCLAYAKISTFKSVMTSCSALFNKRKSSSSSPSSSSSSSSASSSTDLMYEMDDISSSPFGDDDEKQIGDAKKMKMNNRDDDDDDDNNDEACDRSLDALRGNDDDNDDEDGNENKKEEGGEDDEVIHEVGGKKNDTKSSTMLTWEEVQQINKELHPIPTLWWVGGLVVTVIFTLVTMTLFFDVLWYEVVLSMILGFALSFIVIQSAGDTDISPLLVVGKLTQLIFALISPGNYQTNLIAANVPSSASSQAVGMICDLKTGLLMRVSPKQQFISQAVGSLFGIFFSVATYLIMISAYPCILTLEGLLNCNFQVPSGAAWYGIAFALNASGNIIDCFPPHCLEAIAFAGVIGIVVPIVSKILPNKISIFMININAFGLAFVINQPYLGIALIIGCLIVEIWKKINLKHCLLFYIVVASGFSSGEGVGGLLLAILSIMGFNKQWCILVPDYLPYICSSG